MATDLEATLAAEEIPLVDISRAFDITTPPSHPRVSFPDVATPYARTFLGTLPVLVDKQRLADELRTPVHKLPNLFNQIRNVSSSPEGVCYVTGPLLTLTNSHAGLHADQPRHWLEDFHFEFFSKRQYNGTAVVLDVSQSPEVRDYPHAITSDLIQRTATRAGVALEGVHRLLLRTYSPRTPFEWDPDFAYLTPEAGFFLGSLPHLVLFGTDAPSVDKADASPIHRCAHGGLWEGKVALLEGYESTILPLGTHHGVLQTKLLDFPHTIDARQAVSFFYLL